MNSSDSNKQVLSTDNNFSQQQDESKVDCDDTKNQIKGIIFDFDGVLSSFLIRLGWPIVSAALMVKPDLTENKIVESSLEIFNIVSTLDKKPKNTSLMKFAFQIGKKLGMSNFQAFKFIFTLLIMYARSRKKIVPKIGVREVLREVLAQDYKIVLLTNTSTKVISAAMEKIPELKEFDLILTRDDIEKIKPDASGFFKALKLLDLRADEVISIGDQASDLIAGNKAGVTSIAISSKNMKPMKPMLEEQNPAFIIRDLRELPNILRFLRDCIIEDIRHTVDLTETSLHEYLSDNDSNYTLGP